MKLFNELLSNLGQKKFMRIITWLIVIEEYNNPSLSELGGMLNLTKAQMTIKTDWLTKRTRFSSKEFLINEIVE